MMDRERIRAAFALYKTERGIWPPSEFQGEAQRLGVSVFTLCPPLRDVPAFIAEPLPQSPQPEEQPTPRRRRRSAAADR